VRSGDGTRLVRLIALLLAGCAPAVPPEYARARAAAERAYVHGRYLEAAKLWTHAADRAASATDRTEARYRQAVSLVRGGHAAAARPLLEQLAAGKSARAPRAAWDLAGLEREAGEIERSDRRLESLIRTHPDSALATRALQLRIRLLKDRGEDAVLAYLRELEPNVGRTALGEHLAYERAAALERSGDTAAAAAAYRESAARTPYPHGALWDDALYRSARLEAELDRPREAIALLEHMLSHRERALFQGSYERPRYAPARFLIAELYRDALKDPARAREEFRRLWDSHPTSRLRDDAKWQAALIARAQGDQAGACRDVRDLARVTKDSRFAPCAPLVCPELGTAGPDCRDYIRRQIGPVE
jgi:tetratricopeptide (TPR) repeat protein